MIKVIPFKHGEKAKDPSIYSNIAQYAMKCQFLAESCDETDESHIACIAAHKEFNAYLNYYGFIAKEDITKAIDSVIYKVYETREEIDHG